MDEFLEILALFIVFDIFIGYGLYSLGFVIFSIFSKENVFLNNLDRAANKIIILSGVIYLLILALSVYFSITETKLDIARRNPYWWVQWLQPLIWVLITQLLWIKKLRTIKIIRIIISLLLIVSYERYVIIITSFDREFVQSSQLSGLSIFEIIFGLMIKILFFTFIAYVYHFITEKAKQWKKR